MSGWDNLMASLATGCGGSLLGFVGGIIQQRHSRENKFEKRFDKELDILRKKVDECEKERDHVLLVTMSLKMIVPEMQRLDKGNLVLKHVAGALSALPENDKTFDELIRQLNDIPFRQTPRAE